MSVQKSNSSSSLHSTGSTSSCPSYNTVFGARNEVIIILK